jgi:hypothetical protein
MILPTELEEPRPRFRFTLGTMFIVMATVTKQAMSRMRQVGTSSV